MQPSPHAASPDPVGSGTVVHDVHSSVHSSVHTTPHAPAAAVAVKNGVRTDGRAASSAGARTHNSSLSVQSTRTRESGAPATTLGSDPTWPLNVAEGGGGQLASLERALDWLVDTRQPFLGSYTVLGGHASRAVGGQGLVQFVRRTHGAEEFAIKFYTYRPAFERERALYNDTALQSMMPATREIVSNEDGAVAAQGFAFPPCIVLERGESLETWALREDRDFITTLQARIPLFVVSPSLHLDFPVPNMATSALVLVQAARAVRAPSCGDACRRACVWRLRSAGSHQA